MLYRVIARDSYSLPDPKAVSRPFSPQLILPSLLGHMNYGPARARSDIVYRPMVTRYAINYTITVHYH